MVSGLNLLSFSKKKAKTPSKDVYLKDVFLRVKIVVQLDKIKVFWFLCALRSRRPKRGVLRGVKAFNLHSIVTSLISIKRKETCLIVNEIL